MIEFEGKIINEIEANEYGGVELPPKIECYFPLKKNFSSKEEFYKYAKAHLSSAYGEMVKDTINKYPAPLVD